MTVADNELLVAFAKELLDDVDDIDGLAEEYNTSKSEDILVTLKGKILLILKKIDNHKHVLGEVNHRNVYILFASFQEINFDETIPESKLIFVRRSIMNLLALH